MGESKDNIIEFGAEQATGNGVENMPAEAVTENAIETVEAMPLDVWESGMREFGSTHSVEEFDRKLEAIRAVFAPESLKLLYAQLTREIFALATLGSSENATVDHEAMRSAMERYVIAAEAYYKPYFTEKSYDEPDILPQEYRAAFYVRKILEAEETGEIGKIKDYIEPCATAMPPLRDSVLGYVKSIAEQMNAEKAEAQDEMAYLSAQLKRKAKELEAMGQNEAAEQIYAQLRALGQM